MAGISYSIKKSRINRGYYPGFTLESNGNLTSLATQSEHYLCIAGIDSAENDSKWGRLCLHAEYDEGMILTVYAVALNEDSFFRRGEATGINDFLCNPEESITIKLEFMNRVGAKRYVNQQDSLLMDLQGRYLYMLILLIGEGSATISGIRVDQLGDNFMNTFPEIYREEGSFFNRYLAVFSTIYNDFQTDIDHVSSILDIDSCRQDLLVLYAGWMGIELDESFHQDEWLRTLVKEAYQLNRMRGTRWVIERISEIVLGEKVRVLEQNVMKKYATIPEMKQFYRLFGDSPYSVTVLVQKEIMEREKAKLLFLLDQYKPIRSKIHIVCLKAGGNLDSHTYLDLNAQMLKEEEGVLDDHRYMDGIITLQ